MYDNKHYKLILTFDNILIRINFLMFYNCMIS